MALTLPLSFFSRMVSKASQLNNNNPILQPWEGPYGGVPAFHNIKKEHLEPAVLTAIEDALDGINLIANNKSENPTFDNTVSPYERIFRRFERVASVYGIFTSLLNDDEVQSIESRLEPKLAEFRDKIYQNTNLFNRFSFIYEANDLLTSEQKRLVLVICKDFASNGAKLVKQEDKNRLLEINQSLAALYTNFSHNVLHDEALYTQLDEKDLLGLPSDLIFAAKESAKEKNLNDYVILNTRSSVEPFLTYSKCRELREKIWRSFVSRGDNNDSFDNGKIIADILKLRSERANLLGFQTHSHWRLENTMAKKPEAALKLMTDVWDLAKKRVAREVEEMLKIAKSDGLTIIEPWDYRFYAEKVRKANYDFNMELLKPYFQLEHLRNGLFFTASKLFGLYFSKVMDVPVYHPDVSVWEVKNTQGEHIGLWFFDPYARKGKQSGAWMNEYRAQERFDGNITTIVSNNANFVKVSPVLISFDDGNTLFHEFGHALHGLLSNVTYPGVSGTRVVTDFVEFPSQLLEYWLTVPEVLQKFALNEKGESVPQELIDKLKKAKTFNKGFETVEYLSAALLDMKIHLAATPNKDINIKVYEKECLLEIGMPKEIVMRHRTTHFSHIWSSDMYSSCYWSYLWADTLTADAWEAFVVDGNGPWDEAVAKRLLDNVFSKGNTLDPEDAYFSFRGKPVSIDALLRKRGFI
jgi:peptidyl-dipeptidase Dcp